MIKRLVPQNNCLLKVQKTSFATIGKIEITQRNREPTVKTTRSLDIYSSVPLPGRTPWI